MSKKTRSIVIAVAILLVLAIAAFGIYRATRPAPVEGQKTITVEVIHGDKTHKDFPITTVEETLRKALEQENLDKAEFFFDSDGVLNVTYGYYWVAGAERYGALLKTSFVCQ